MIRSSFNGEEPAHAYSYPFGWQLRSDLPLFRTRIRSHQLRTLWGFPKQVLSSSTSLSIFCHYTATFQVLSTATTKTYIRFSCIDFILFSSVRNSFGNMAISSLCFLIILIGSNVLSYTCKISVCFCRLLHPFSYHYQKMLSSNTFFSQAAYPRQYVQGNEKQQHKHGNQLRTVGKEIMTAGMIGQGKKSCVG